METNWAAEHLQTIRTLMERSAIYRRALAPIMIFNGTLGTLGAVFGCLVHLHSACAFVLFWAAVAAVALTGSFLLVRRQALKDSEPLWSPPTRRVAQAMLPALAIGLFFGIVVMIWLGDARGEGAGVVSITWCLAYGCALHAAGFFAPRGIRLLGWLFVIAGCGTILAIFTRSDLAEQLLDNRGLFMGITFGGFHLAYGIYLYFTEKRGNET